jgi:hypothetical protein
MILEKHNGELPDISQCYLKWATAQKLKEWRSTLFADMATFKDGIDRSGQHNFYFEILEDISTRAMSRGKKHMLYLLFVLVWMQKS